MNYQGNQIYNVPLWSGRPTFQQSNNQIQSNTLYTMMDLCGNWDIGILNGNQIPLPRSFHTFSIDDLSANNIDANLINTTNIFASSGNIDSFTSATTSASYRIQTPEVYMNDTTLTAYGGNLYANGQLIGGISSNSNVSQWANYISINNINANSYNIINVSNLSSLSINTGVLNTTLSSASNLRFSSINGIAANISSLQISSINGINVSNIVGSVSNWSFYPALTTVDMNNRNITNANQINTSQLTANSVNTNGISIGNGACYWNGNAQFNGTGNTFSPYWYNFTMDANVTTAQPNTIYAPTNSQYFKDWFVGINCLDVESILTASFTSTKLHAYTGGLVVPTGYIDFKAHNYRSVPILPPYTLKDYRGQVYIGTEGYGAGGYIGINYDNYETLYNQGCSIILNADSVLTNPLGGASRITSQAARNQLLGTVGTEIYAGYAGIDPAYTYFAGIEQYFVNSDGTPAQYFRTRGGVTIPPAGARTDLTAECPSDTSSPSRMYIYSSQKANIYTDGDLYIGYGDSTPPYGYNSSQQKVHVINTADIQGRTDTGVDIINTNSLQGLGSNSFIQNVHYLVGYALTAERLSSYETVITAPKANVEFYRSNVFFYYNSNGNELSNSYNAVFSTISSITYSNVYYTSNYIRNNLNVSSLKTLPASSTWNEILGISTILSSFILNIDTASISSITTNAIGSIQDIILTSDIDANQTQIYNINNIGTNSITIADTYNNPYEFAFIGTTITDPFFNTYSQLSYIQTNSDKQSRNIAQDWSYYGQETSFSANYNSITDISGISLNTLQFFDSNLHITSAIVSQSPVDSFGKQLPINILSVDYFPTIITDLSNNVSYVSATEFISSNGITILSSDNQANIQFSLPSGSKNYLSYTDTLGNITQVASDWWNFLAQGDVNINGNNLNGVNTIDVTQIQLPYLNTITGNDAGELVIQNTTTFANNSISQVNTIQVDAIHPNQNGYIDFGLTNIQDINGVYPNYVGIPDPFGGYTWDLSYTGANTITDPYGTTFPQLSYYPDGGGSLRYLAQDWSYYGQETSYSANHNSITDISAISLNTLQFFDSSNNSATSIASEALPDIGLNILSFDGIPTVITYPFEYSIISASEFLSSNGVSIYSQDTAQNIQFHLPLGAGNYLSYTDTLGNTTQVASDWYAFSPQGSVDFNLQNINNVGQITSRVSALYDAGTGNYGNLQFTNGNLQLNSVPVASTWSNYISSDINFSNVNLLNVNGVNVNGNIMGTQDSSELDNFTTWVLGGYNTSAITYVTTDFSSRLVYMVNGGTVQKVANLNDVATVSSNIVTYPVVSNYTSAGISTNGIFQLVNSNVSLTTGHYKLSYSACGNNTTSSNWSIISWVRAGTSNGANKLYLTTPGSTVDTVQKYLTNSGLLYLSSNGTYNVFMEMSNYSGSALTLSNVNLILEKYPV